MGSSSNTVIYFFFFRVDFFGGFLEEISLFFVLGGWSAKPIFEIMGWVIDLFDLLKMLATFFDLGVEIILLIPLFILLWKLNSSWGILTFNIDEVLFFFSIFWEKFDNSILFYSFLSKTHEVKLGIWSGSLKAFWCVFSRSGVVSFFILSIA